MANYGWAHPDAGGEFVHDEGSYVHDDSVESEEVAPQHIVRAVAESDAATLPAWLSQGHDANARGPDHATLLHTASTA